jgi:hypothetical protein
MNIKQLTVIINNKIDLNFKLPNLIEIKIKNYVPVIGA